MDDVRVKCGRCGHEVFGKDDGTYVSHHPVNDPRTGELLDTEERECEDGFAHGPIWPVGPPQQ